MPAIQIQAITQPDRKSFDHTAVMMPPAKIVCGVIPSENLQIVIPVDIRHCWRHGRSSCMQKFRPALFHRAIVRIHNVRPRLLFADMPGKHQIALPVVFHISNNGSLGKLYFFARNLHDPLQGSIMLHHHPAGGVVRCVVIGKSHFREAIVVQIAHRWRRNLPCVFFGRVVDINPVNGRVIIYIEAHTL